METNYSRHMSKPGKSRQLTSDIAAADTRLSYFKHTKDTRIFSFLSSFLSIEKKNRVSRSLLASQVFAEVSEKRSSNSADHTAPRNIFPKLVFHRSGGKRTDNKLTRVASSRVLIIQHTPNKWALVPRSTVGSRDTTARFSRRRASIRSRRHMANPFATA